MIPARTAVQARELHASGWTVSAIARHLGHDRRTVRIYLTGARDPGQPRTDTSDLFGPFGAYANRRLREDPHLSATALHRELAGLGGPCRAGKDQPAAPGVGVPVQVLQRALTKTRQRPRQPGSAPAATKSRRAPAWRR